MLPCDVSYTLDTDHQSSEYETDSESEEEAPKPVFRPVFVRKDKRGMTQEKAAAEAEERIRQEDELREQRKNDSKEIAGETIRRELQESEFTSSPAPLHHQVPGASAPPCVTITHMR